MLLESKPPRTTRTDGRRALPQVPPVNGTPLVQRRLDLPPSNAARSTFEDDGHYTDVHSVVVRRRPADNSGARTGVEANGHYSDVRSIYAGDGGGGRVPTMDDPYHYIDIDRLANQSGSGYEGLDPAISHALHQSQRPRDYVRLGVDDARDAAEHVEMNDIAAGNDNRTPVSKPRRNSSLLCPHVQLRVEGTHTEKKCRRLFCFTAF